MMRCATVSGCEVLGISAGARVDLDQGIYGAFNDTLAIDYDDAVDPTRLFGISLSGSVEEPTVPVMVLRDQNGVPLDVPHVYDFGGRLLDGPGSAVEFHVFNPGTGNLVIHGIDIVNNNTENNFTKNGGPTTIVPHTYATFTVTYLPLEPGNHSATVAIDGSAGSMTLSLTGHSLANVMYSGFRTLSGTGSGDIMR